MEEYNENNEEQELSLKEKLTEKIVVAFCLVTCFAFFVKIVIF
jgi:hypothetical protein